MNRGRNYVFGTKCLESFPQPMAKGSEINVPGSFNNFELSQHHCSQPCRLWTRIRCGFSDLKGRSGCCTFRALKIWNFVDFEDRGVTITCWYFGTLKYNYIPNYPYNGNMFWFFPSDFGPTKIFSIAQGSESTTLVQENLKQECGIGCRKEPE